jgi:hypothetical protein
MLSSIPVGATKNLLILHAVFVLFGLGDVVVGVIDKNDTKNEAAEMGRQRSLPGCSHRRVVAAGPQKGSWRQACSHRRERRHRSLKMGNLALSWRSLRHAYPVHSLRLGLAGTGVPNSSQDE